MAIFKFQNTQLNPSHAIPRLIAHVPSWDLLSQRLHLLTPVGIKSDCHDPGFAGHPVVILNTFANGYSIAATCTSFGGKDIETAKAQWSIALRGRYFPLDFQRRTQLHQDTQVLQLGEGSQQMSKQSYINLDAAFLIPTWLLEEFKRNSVFLSPEAIAVVQQNCDYSHAQSSTAELDPPTGTTFYDASGELVGEMSSTTCSPALDPAACAFNPWDSGAATAAQSVGYGYFPSPWCDHQQQWTYGQDSSFDHPAHSQPFYPAGAVDNSVAAVEQLAGNPYACLDVAAESDSERFQIVRRDSVQECEEVVVQPRKQEALVVETPKMLSYKDVVAKEATKQEVPKREMTERGVFTKAKSDT